MNKTIALEDAADIVCMNCVEDTLNDNSYCEECPVRKTMDYINEKRNAMRSVMKEINFSTKEMIGQMIDVNLDTPDIIEFSMQALNTYEKNIEVGILVKKRLARLKREEEAHMYLVDVAKEKLGDKFDNEHPWKSPYAITDNAEEYEHGMKLTIYEDNSRKVEKEHIIIYVDEF